MNLGSPWSIYDEFMVRYLWKFFFYYYIFENAVIVQLILFISIIIFFQLRSTKNECSIPEKLFKSHNDGAKKEKYLINSQYSIILKRLKIIKHNI